MLFTSLSARAELTGCLDLTTKGESISILNKKKILPDLASHFAFEQQGERERKLAELMSSAGQTVMQQAPSRGEGGSAKFWMFDRFSHLIASRVTGQGTALLSHFGRVDLMIKPDLETKLAGSQGGVFSSLSNEADHLLFSEVDLQQSLPNTKASIGIGQRWQVNQWLFGFNTFVDHLFQVDANQATFGSELWSDYLKLSANYYNPIDSISNQGNLGDQINRGYDISTEGFLPFYRQLGLKLKWQAFLEKSDTGLMSETWESASRSVQLALTYHPIPLITFSVSHQQINNGASQNTLGLSLSFNFGQSLKKQLSTDPIDTFRTAMPDRYTKVQRR